MPRGAKKIDGPKSEVPGVAWDKNANKWKVRLSKGFILNPIVLTLSPEWLCKGIGKQKRKHIGHFNTQLEAENQMYKALKEFKASKKKKKHLDTYQMYLSSQVGAKDEDPPQSESHPKPGRCVHRSLSPHTPWYVWFDNVRFDELCQRLAAVVMCMDLTKGDHGT